MRKIFCIFIFLLLFTPGLFSQSLIHQADSLWEMRGENFNPETLLADSSRINEAITLYKQVLETATYAEKEEATWKLMRAYYFKGRYTTNDSELKKNIKDSWWSFFVRGREDMQGIDGSIITSPKVWKASGHVDSFSDVFVKCLKCKRIIDLLNVPFGEIEVPNNINKFDVLKKTVYFEGICDSMYHFP